jgi:hypothetical protein
MGAGDNKWVAMSDDSDSSDEVRVVKSGKERALDTFKKYIGGIRAAMKARDYYAIQTEFDELMKSTIKAKAFLKEGVPKPLVRILVDLEDYDEGAVQDLVGTTGTSLESHEVDAEEAQQGVQDCH